jgi:hypothetical protein
MFFASWLCTYSWEYKMVLINQDNQESSDDNVEKIRNELVATSPSAKRKVFEKFVSAALGSIPWVGGFLSAAADLKFEQGDAREDNLQSQWLEEHTRKLRRLSEALNDIGARFEKLGDQIDERIQSEEYLDLVRKSFRTWDTADTDEKRKYIANLITNAGGTKLTSDDVIRLFIDWLDIYHEAHLAVVREIYKSPGSTRYDIWEAIYTEFPREDSAEADLFRMLIRDLSTGGVIRQARDTTADGQFLKKPRTKARGFTSSTMESSFEDTKPYVLTELGKQFVHYAMSEVVQRIEETPGTDNS